ncbi:MAG: hypothetical protein J2P47_00910 [Acetobacteraceae bacterium]|nr:hypothetical protein [Acetobacteraceae bacterium]
MALSEQRKKIGEQIAKLRGLERERDILRTASAPAMEQWTSAVDALDYARADIEKTTRASIDYQNCRARGR